jgi:hypothetical protein
MWGSLENSSSFVFWALLRLSSLDNEPFKFNKIQFAVIVNAEIDISLFSDGS